MTPEYLQTGFEQAKAEYPYAWVQEYRTVWDEEEQKDVDGAWTWQLVDACSASFKTPKREGMLVLQEWRPGTKYPRNHWGFMVAKSEMQAKVK